MDPHGLAVRRLRRRRLVLTLAAAVARWPFQQMGHPPGPLYLWPRAQVFQPPLFILGLYAGKVSRLLGVFNPLGGHVTSRLACQVDYKLGPTPAWTNGRGSRRLHLEQARNRLPREHDKGQYAQCSAVRHANSGQPGHDHA
jgi:hypothetical protein